MLSFSQGASHVIDDASAGFESHGKAYVYVCKGYHLYAYVFINVHVDVCIGMPRMHDVKWVVYEGGEGGERAKTHNEAHHDRMLLLVFVRLL